jgi:putative oxidoreductase
MGALSSSPYAMFSDPINGISRAFYQQSFGLFVLRLVTGGIFLLHGAAKLGSIQMTTVMMAHFGLVPSFEWAWFIALLEVLGGAALIFGVATRFFGAVLGIEMVVAVLLGGFAHGIGPHEFELLLAAASFAIALIGSGSWSLYKMECDNCGGFLCEGNVCVEVD